MEAILACTVDGGIGLANKLPWRIKEDLQLFKRITTSPGKLNAVIMGRKTWESIGKPLPDRLNIILSKTLEAPKNTFVVKDLKELETLLKEKKDVIHTVFLIGGASLYTLFFQLDIIKKVHLSLIGESYKHDTSIDLNLIYNNKFKLKKKTTFTEFTYFEYLRAPF